MHIGTKAQNAKNIRNTVNNEIKSNIYASSSIKNTLCNVT